MDEEKPKEVVKNVEADSNAPKKEAAPSATPAPAGLLVNSVIFFPPDFLRL